MSYHLLTRVDEYTLPLLKTPSLMYNSTYSHVMDEKLHVFLLTTFLVLKHHSREMDCKVGEAVLAIKKNIELSSESSCLPMVLLLF